jgi:hypothetical protein
MTIKTEPLASRRVLAAAGSAALACVALETRLTGRPSSWQQTYRCAPSSRSSSSSLPSVRSDARPRARASIQELPGRRSIAAAAAPIIPSPRARARASSWPETRRLRPRSAARADSPKRSVTTASCSRRARSTSSSSGGSPSSLLHRDRLSSSRCHPLAPSGRAGDRRHANRAASKSASGASSRRSS